MPIKVSCPMTAPGDGGVACSDGDHTGSQLHATPPSPGTIVRYDALYGHLTLALTLTLSKRRGFVNYLSGVFPYKSPTHLWKQGVDVVRVRVSTECTRVPRLVPKSA